MTKLQRTIRALMLTAATTTLISGPVLAAPAPDSVPTYRQQIPESDAVQKLSAWPAGPRLAGTETIAKYGAPNEITDERMIWHDAGPFKRILLVREELPHHFPIVHMDYLEHTISYDVPPDKADDVLAFDGSITIYRVGGELSARCDLESNNVLTLNLVHQIVQNNMSVEQARKAFGEAVIARTSAQSAAITEELQFQPPTYMVAADTDSVSIPGAPMPANASGQSVGPDAETLALLIATDIGKAHAAMIAKDKQIAAPILEYARMMHESYGRHAKAAADLGLNHNVQPVMTNNVSALKEKHATTLAQIVLLDSEEFSRAYLDMEVEALANSQQLIDERLAMTNNEQVRNYLIETRRTITTHLQEARELHGTMARTAFR